MSRPFAALPCLSRRADHALLWAEVTIHRATYEGWFRLMQQRSRYRKANTLTLTTSAFVHLQECADVVIFLKDGEV